MKGFLCSLVLDCYLPLVFLPWHEFLIMEKINKLKSMYFFRYNLGCLNLAPKVTNLLEFKNKKKILLGKLQIQSINMSYSIHLYITLKIYIYISIYFLPISRSFYLSIYESIYLYLYVWINLLINHSIYQSIYLSNYISIYLFIFLSICLSFHHLLYLSINLLTLFHVGGGSFFPPPHPFLLNNFFLQK